MVATVDILIVDDDQAIAEFLEVILRDRGYQVCTALGGEQAIEIVERSRPRLILLDLMLAPMSGRELARSLRNSLSLQDLPILVMSAHDDLAEAAESIGAAGYLHKPFDLDELFSSVARYAGVRD